MKLYKRLSRYLDPYLGRLSAATVCMGAVAGLNALRIYLIKPLQDQVFVGHDLTMLSSLLWWIPAISVAIGLFSYAQNYLMEYIGLSATADLRQEMFDHLQIMSMDFFSTTSSGKLVARFTNDLTALQKVIARTPIYFIRDGLTAVLNIGLIFYLNWRFALVTISMLPVAAAIIAVLGKTLRRVGRKGQEQMGDLYSVIQENVHAAPVVKAYTAERIETARFEKSNSHFLALGLRFAQADTLSSPLMEVIGALVLSFLLLKGGLDVIHGVWTAGSFLAFITYAVMTYRPLKNFAELNAQLQLGLASSERIFELLDQSPSVKEMAGAKSLPAFADSLVYDNVSFRYLRHGHQVMAEGAAEPAANSDQEETGHHWALQDIHLTIRRGEAVALVGRSGAGKSTMALLVTRFYDPTSGRILMDGQDIKTAKLASLRSQMGLVTQEVLLFNETVRYNIAYGKQDAGEAEIEAAAKAANAHDFIRRMPKGYDTLIGERGIRLSGGERQRLSIARALLKNPPILVLDEATSALDAESERLVQEAIERLMQNRTAIVIAHRLATIRKADRIVVLERGRIAEQGSHDSLIEKKGTYHKLHSLQIL